MDGQLEMTGFMRVASSKKAQNCMEIGITREIVISHSINTCKKESFKSMDEKKERDLK